MLKTIVTVIAAAAALAAAVIAPADWIPVARDTPVGMLVVPFLTFASVVYISYVLSNLLSGILGQGDAGRDARLYWIDYVGSVIALLSFTLVTLVVILGVQGLVRGFPTLTTWADVFREYVWLIALTIFSWIDVAFLQGHKHGSAWQYYRTQRSIAPVPALAPAPVIVAAPPAAAPAVAPAPAVAAVVAPAPAVVTRPAVVQPPSHVGTVIGALLVIAAIIALLLLLTPLNGRVRSAFSASPGMPLCDSMTTSVITAGGITRSHTGC